MEKENWRMGVWRTEKNAVQRWHFPCGTKQKQYVETKQFITMCSRQPPVASRQLPVASCQPLVASRQSLFINEHFTKKQIGAK